MILVAGIGNLFFGDDGFGVAVAQQLATTPPPGDPGQGSPLPTHRVRPGEYLSFIANCYDVSWQQPYWENRDVIGPQPDLLRAGEVLRIPPKDLQPGDFRYRQLFEPGHQTSLACPTDSPKAQAGTCTTG